ncbi:unnamed protein product [Cuscuta campestris]|uniref:Cwf19-like C-terminal domain-containing protein n=1 Tax=Cuscuta campestris TaxID=132261 RepID=A0A484NGH4_9ASTE|nr:unnamed protein product [Cuscuta campestris]
MLSKLKFIPRDQLHEEKNKDSDDSQKHRQKSGHKRTKDRKKKRSYCSSDDDLERVKTKSRKKKWYDSDKDISSHSDGSNSASDISEKKQNHTSRNKSQKRKHRRRSDDDARGCSKIKERSQRKDVSSDGSSSDEAGGKPDNESVRKEMGLEWMLRPAESSEKARKTADSKLEENLALPQTQETRTVNPRELNPYLKNNGSGYPEDSEGNKAGVEQFLSSAVVGDGGASWRLKSLKRAQEQAAREGRKLDEVVEERWSSLNHLAVSVASHKAAPTHAHLHAIKSRRQGLKENEIADNPEKGSLEKKEAEEMKAKQGACDGKGDESHSRRIDGSTSRYIVHELSSKQKKKEEDADMHLAHKIVRHQQYSISSRADDEYDYDDVPMKKSRKRVGETDCKSAKITSYAQGIVTQQERCQFCFENPKRPKHLVVAIANFTYLSIPPWQQVIPGHCCILTLQHESATRSVDDNVWEEFRNFKKCLIMIFAQQEKDCVFLETVMGLAKQRRHCLVECIPIPRDVGKQAPLYYKKAIDEAEDEWSQHNAKKLIDTSVKGLRASIPKDFPYFHVEFGLDRGFVHVIDDEKDFKSSFGLNVIRGMLKLPPEDMHRSRRHESVEAQKHAVASFAKLWEPFNWTNQLR